MKRFIFTLALAVATPAFAQCPLGGCQTRYARSYGYTRAVQTYNASPFVYGGFTANACAPVQTVQPCEPIQTVEPCQAVETVEPCSPVATCTQCETCECSPCQCEYTPKVEGKIIVDQCVGGACPLRKTAQVAVKTTGTAVKAATNVVASLLGTINATRARYGLAALQYDQMGAKAQASVCATTQTLQHGSGYAEILAQNSQGLETAIQQWLNSPGHRSLLLGGYRYADVGVVRDASGKAWCAVRFR